MTVKINQIWKDNDKRVSDRYLKVFKIEDSKAHCYVSNSEDFQETETPKTTKVSIKRFKPNSTGYKLIHDAE